MIVVASSPWHSNLLNSLYKKMFAGISFEDLKEFYKSFGRLVAENRNKQGFSQEEVAGSLECSRVSLALLESGEQQVYLARALELTSLLQIPIEEVVRCFEYTKLKHAIKGHSKEIADELGVLIEKLKKEHT